MSGKGSGRRRENTALVEANWPFPDRSKAEPILPGQSFQFHEDLAGNALVKANMAAAFKKMEAAGIIPAARKADQAVADAMRAENLARAITNTEQDAKDG